MRVVFAGTPRAAVPSLEAILRSRHEVAAVITRADAPAGRGRRPAASPVAERAAEAGLELLKPARARDPEFLDRLRAIAPDCCPVAAYGALLPQSALDIPPYGWVNLHFSLLPAWRGAAPVQHAVLHGDDITGATTFRIVKELDAGPVFGVVTEPIRPDDTAGDLLGRIAVSGAELLVATLDGIESGELRPQPQPSDGISLAPKIGVARRAGGLGPPGHRDRAADPRLHAEPRSLDGARRQQAEARPGDRGRQPGGARHARARTRRAARGPVRRAGRHRDRAGPAGRGAARGQAADDRRRVGPWSAPSVPANRSGWAPRSPAEDRAEMAGRTARRARNAASAGQRRTPRADPVRRAVCDVLLAVATRGAYANLLLPSVLRDRQLSGRDAALATELCYGTLRGQGSYDAILNACSDRPVVKMDPPVREVLRLGVHQLLGTRIAAHAAVATSVDLAKDVAGSRTAGFVNAVLRRVSTRDLEAWVTAVAPDRRADPAGYLAIRHSYPGWIVAAFREALAEDPHEAPEAPLAGMEDESARAAAQAALAGMEDESARAAGGGPRRYGGARARRGRPSPRPRPRWPRGTSRPG